jgi:LmbE family N-acetylglucosaminyl deacetylase
LNKRAIIFAPHPDDETLGCGGTIARKIREGYDVIIAIMTDGRYALSRVGACCGPTPDEMVPIRRKEVEKATKILGVRSDKLLFFDFEDRKLSEHENEAEAKVGSLFEANPPTEIYFTYRKDYHMDHQATNRIISHSVKRLNNPTLEYQYSIAQSARRSGPLIAGWSLQDRLSNLLEHNLVQVDVSEFLPLKKAAIKEFKSQLAILSDKRERPVLIRIERYLRKKETFFVNSRKS